MICILKLQQKIKCEYGKIMSEWQNKSLEDILEHIKDIYAIETVKQVFDSAGGIYIPPKTLGYLLNKNVSAIDELSRRIVKGDGIDFYIENVNTAIEEIQCELENKKQ